MTGEEINLRAEEIFPNESALDFYRRGMEYFHLQLVYLNTNIFILDHVLAFPHHLFTDPDDTIFFRMVFENFFNASLLIITKVSTDKGGDLFTLPRFKNNIRKSILPNYKNRLEKRLKQSEFNSNIDALLEKTRVLRNQQIAHVAEDLVLGKADLIPVVFCELKLLRDRLIDIFKSLAFSVEYIMLPFQYNPDIQYRSGYDVRPDIEKILDTIVERSLLLSMPEIDPIRWDWQKELLSPEDMNSLNYYRRKFHLEEV